MTEIDPYFVRSLAAKVALSYFEDARNAELAILAEILCDDLMKALPPDQFDGDEENVWTPTLEAVSAALKTALMAVEWPTGPLARDNVEALTRLTAELLGYDLVPRVAD